MTASPSSAHPASTDAAIPSTAWRGVALLTLAVLLFACMDTTTKYLAGAYAVPLIMVMRYGVNLALLVAIAGPRQGRRLYGTQRTGLVVVRGLCLVVASLFLGLALQRMPVAESTAIVFLAPMLVVLMAGPLLGETIRLASWVAVVLGFAGVLLIVRPGGGLDLLAIGYLMVVVAATVAYQLLSRLLARTETAVAMLFYSALVGTLCFGAMLPWSMGSAVPGGLDLMLLLSLGVTGGLGHFLFTAAFRFTPASVLAPISYLQLVWAGLLGWLVFGHLPDTLTLAGMGAVLVAGVLVAMSSRRR